MSQKKIKQKVRKVAKEHLNTAFKKLGRLLIRDGKTAGLFIPFQGHDLKSGIYELRETLGETTIEYIGQPAMPNVDYQAFDLQSLYLRRDVATMTAKEVDSLEDV